MSSLRDIQTKLRTLHAFQKETNASASQFQTEWQRLLESPISHKNAEYFISHYREMYNKKTKGGRRTLKKVGAKRKTYRKRTKATRVGKRGGSYALTGADLKYAMTPGMTAGVYGNFPTELGTDPASIQNLDVFYGSALTRGCGIENSTRQIPETMGSNKVGGKRKKTVRRYKHRGGALMESVNMRAFPIPSYSTAPPNFTQVVNNAYAGVPPFASPSPVDHTWNYAQVANTPINPASITPITGDFNQLAFSTST